MSFGFATEAEKRDGAWTNPVGTCLFHKYVQPCINSERFFSRCSVSDLSADCYPSLSCRSSVRLSPVCLCVCVSNGRAVHYNGSSLLQWKSVRLDVGLLPGETGDKLFFFFMYNLTCLFFELINLKIHTAMYVMDLNLKALYLIWLLFQKNRQKDNFTSMSCFFNKICCRML